MWVASRFLSSVIQRAQYVDKPGFFLRPRNGSLPELELRYVQCTCCWRSRVPVAGADTLNAAISPPCEPRRVDDGKPLDAAYTPEEREAILRLLNNATAAELARVKLLRGHKCLNIVNYRTKNGPFRTLESLVNVPRLKHKSAVIVFNSILNPVKKGSKATIHLVNFIKPDIDKSWLEGANSIVSIVCGINKVAWAHVDRRMTVLDWQHLKCPHFLKGNYLASAYLKDVSSVVALLPSADFYIIEKPSISVQNTTLFPVVAHMRSVEAMLFALLENKTSAPDSNLPPKVLNMMRAAVGRHFGLMVGESRTSGVAIMRQLMVESVTQRLPRINFPQELFVKYRKSLLVHSGIGDGDELCDALLQAIAFYELLGAPPC